MNVHGRAQLDFANQSQREGITTVIHEGALARIEHHGGEVTPACIRVKGGLVKITGRRVEFVYRHRPSRSAKERLDLVVRRGVELICNQGKPTRQRLIDVTNDVDRTDVYARRGPPARRP